MKFISFVLAIFLNCNVFSSNGDTIVVQTFTNGWPLNSGWLAPMEGKFVFPSDTNRYEKILIYYTLKCNPAQSPACGEWDYLSYINLFEHTGLYDSTLLSHSNFTVNGASPDSFLLRNAPSYSYNPFFQYSIVYTDTILLYSYPIGTGNSSIQLPFNSGNPDSRTQFLWKKTELNTAGMTAGAITGMKFFIQNGSGEFNTLKIKVKAVTPDSLNSSLPVIDNYTTVYSHNTVFATAGWQNINFTTPFQWDGNSNLVFDISFVESTGTVSLAAENTTWTSCISSTTDEYVLNFDGNDYVSVPSNIFSDIDSAITISFWQYGNPAIQPAEEIIFEGIDSAGHRVLNVHLPWSDGKIYWDAGNTGDSFDRISKAAVNASWYEGKWNHWAFTKDVASGFMRMYLNGAQVMLGGIKLKLMKSIKQFKIGSGGSGTGSFYHGMIDDFCVWNKALDINTIKSIMYKEVTITHPAYAYLVAQFKFNEGQGMSTVDAVAGELGTLIGFPSWASYEGSRIKSFTSSQERPNVIFENGTFTSYIDSSLVIDTIQNQPVMVVLYSDTLHPNIPTDTVYAWTPYYTYIFDQNGQAVDSTLISEDTVLHKSMYNYFGTPFEVLKKWELGRYITPYGNGLDLGQGWRWIYDVTDFRPLLKDTVHLTAGNFQELLDMKFVMIKGVPPRDVVKIENMWQGDFALNNFTTLVPPKTIIIDPNASMFKLRTTVTGHQFDNSTNCAEFCPKIHSLLIDGVTRYSWQIIQDCARNPLYPQGGTWIYNRSGWCPGMPGTTQQLEVTPYVTGSQVTLDYNAQFDNYGNYVTESQLVSYSQPNFIIDAAIDDIISPSRYEIYGRLNPICGRPVVKIKNTGSTTLTSLDIAYRFAGDAYSHYQWTGSLAFLKTQEVALPPLNWNSVNVSSQIFEVLVSSPNGQQDQYVSNNSLTATFDIAPVYNQPVIVQFRTNSFSSENQYKVFDATGTQVFYKYGFLNNTLYQDTLDLDVGCYEFVMYDNDDDGISWWANSDGAGYLKFKLLGGSVVKTFNPDFGAETRYQFSITEPTGINYLVNNGAKVAVFPNPSTGNFYIDFYNQNITKADIKVFSLVGNIVYANTCRIVSGSMINIDLSNLKNGCYILNITTYEGVFRQRIIIE